MELEKIIEIKMMNLQFRMTVGYRYGMLFILLTLLL